jgi:hypothetical protein
MSNCPTCGQSFPSQNTPWLQVDYRMRTLSNGVHLMAMKDGHVMAMGHGDYIDDKNNLRSLED